MLATCLAACIVKRVEPTAADPSADAGPEAGEEQPARGGSAGRGSGGRAGRSAAGEAGDAGSSAVGGRNGGPIDPTETDGGDSLADAGAAGIAGAAGGGTWHAYGDSCEADGGCAVSSCELASAVCGVLPETNACEWGEGTKAGGVTVACGAVATVATDVDCGGCGKTDVKVYFDGKQCWQGLPSCALPEFTGKFFYPHSPLADR